jgi:LacI family transcriptional regulator
VNHRGVTLRDVATAAGVHVSTASRALDPARSSRISAETVTRVRSVSDALGYTPDMVARGLARGTTGTVGIIVASLQEPFISLVVRGISELLEEAGRVAFVAETLEDRSRMATLVEHLVGRRVDALVVTAAREADGPLLKLAAARGTPVVLAVRTVPRASFAAVVGDDARGVRLAVDHLHGLGHRVCAQLRGPGGVSSFSVRERAFERRAADHHLTDVSTAERAIAVTIEEGRRLMELTLAGAQPTAVFAPTDTMAVGSIEAIRAAGLDCPGDVAVIGFNDVPLAEYLTPPLTTVRIPALELGRRAAELALQLIHDPTAKPRRATLAPELVVRGSTTPPRKEPNHVPEPA